MDAIGRRHWSASRITESESHDLIGILIANCKIVGIRFKTFLDVVSLKNNPGRVVRYCLPKTGNGVLYCLQVGHFSVTGGAEHHSRNTYGSCVSKSETRTKESRTLREQKLREELLDVALGTTERARIPKMVFNSTVKDICIVG